MNIKIGIAALTFAALASVSCSTTESSVTWVDFGENPMANPEFHAAMQAHGAPGAEHAHMAQYAGNWNVTGQWWAAPGQEPMPMTGTASTKMVLGGRYMMENFYSDWGGEPFEGLLIQGYDNMKKEYFTIWMDSSSTAPMTAHGTRDAKGVLNTSGMSYDIMTPTGRPMRTTITESGKNKTVMSMFDHTPDGEEFKMMELTYTRR